MKSYWSIGLVLRVLGKDCCYRSLSYAVPTGACGRMPSSICIQIASDQIIIITLPSALLLLTIVWTRVRSSSKSGKRV